jgi:hypothetical protein
MCETMQKLELAASVQLETVLSIHHQVSPAFRPFNFIMVWQAQVFNEFVQLQV